MRRGVRRIAAGVLLIALALGMVACTGVWQTVTQQAGLIIGPVMVAGSNGYVVISVADMPLGGASAIQFGIVGNEAIDFTNIDPASIVAKGKNGFVVHAQNFTANPGKGTLAAANAPTGTVSGEILRISFDVIPGAAPTFTVDKTKVTVVTDANHAITNWNLLSVDYYTK